MKRFLGNKPANFVSPMAFKNRQEENILSMFNHVPENIREDLGEALVWAKNVLTESEGGGHMFDVLPNGPKVVCNFHKPEWSGDHTGRPMFTGSEAVVMAVCEYLNGA